MSDPKIVLGANAVYGLTSPREIADALSGKREHAVVLPVEVPFGGQGRTRVISVPLEREDLVRLAIAATSAVALLDGIRVGV